MPAPNAFPAFITDEYRPGGGFSAFERASASAAERSRQHFEGSFSEIQRIATQALASPRNQAGALDLGTGRYREAAAAAQAHAVALREIATAAERAALANGDTSEATRLYVQAARGAAIEAENVSRETSEQAAAMERLQRELNQTRSATQQVIAGNRGLIQSQDAYGNSSRAARFASVQLGQQLQDVAIQAQAGVPAMQILVQQGTQMGFAMSQMTGRMAAVGQFLSGPWGTAIFLGVAAVGFLTRALTENSEASTQTLTAADALGRAQSALGDMFDLSTGKIRQNTEELRLNALMAAANLRADAQLQAQRSRQALGNAGEESWSSMFRRGVLFGSGENQQRLSREAETQARAVQDILQGIDSGQYSREQAVRLLNRLDTSHLSVSGREIAQAITDQVNAEVSQQIADRIERSVSTGQLDPSLRRDTRGRQREDRRPEQAARAIEEIQRINEAWDAQPRIVDRAVQAMRQLDATLAEAERRKLPRFDEMTAGAERARAAIREGLIREIVDGFEETPKLIGRANEALQELTAAAEQFPELREQIAAAGQTVETALLRPYRELLEGLVDQHDTQVLIAQGREAEARALAIIRDLERDLGDIGKERRQTILESVVALEEQARQFELIRERQQLYLQASGEIRRSLVDLFESGRPGEFFRNIESTFRRLSAEVTVESLFGDVFRQLDDMVTGRGQVRDANQAMAASINTARGELAELTDANRTQRQSVDDVIASLNRLGDAVDAAATRMSAVTGPAGGAETAEAVAARTTEQMLQPFIGGRVSSGYGWRNHPLTGRRSFHAGLDLPQPYGTDVPAALSGRVSHAGPLGGYGNAVIIDHGNGLQTLYGHLSRISVSLDQMVRRGEQVGDVGSTGQSTGNHLHYEVRRDGRHIDPRSIGLAEIQIAVEALGGEMQPLSENMLQVEQVVSALSDTSAVLAGRLGQISDAMNQAASSMGNAADAVVGETIDVTGKRTSDPSAQLDPRTFFSRAFTDLIANVFGKRVGEIVGSVIVDMIQGAQIGSFTDSLLDEVGVRSSRTGARIGGAIGNAIGQAIGGPAGGQIGAIVGSVWGGVVGGLIRGTPRASSTVVGADGRLSVASTSGTRRLRGQTETAADSVIATVERIAEMFGGAVLSGAGSVSIGVRDGNYRVDPTGRGITKTKKGAIDFGEDAEAAIRAAVLDLIQDGVIAGLREGTQRLLKAAKDLDSGIEKALKFESVFQRLKTYLDPVGAALDVLDKEFVNLRRIFEEAGASAEEYAQLEQLYALERERAVREAGERLTSALRGLLDDLTVNNDALSLRDRLAAARAKYDPLAADLAAGRRVDYDAFSDAARMVLDIQRQISGSTSPYFDLLNEITALTRRALADQENIISIATGRPSPLGETPAAEPEYAPVVGAIDGLGRLIVDELGGRLDAANDNLATLIRQAVAAGLGGHAGAGFGTDLHNF